MRRLFVVAVMLLCLASSAFGLSDKEYKQMMKNAEFKQADGALNQAWRNAKESLSSEAFAELKKSQSAWIKRGRDDEAKPLLSRMNRTKAYTAITRARAEYIDNYVQDYASGPGLPEEYDEPEDVPGDLPDDVPDFPDDLPYESDTQTSTQTSSRISLASEEEAAEYLSDALVDLGHIAPNEALESLGTTDINGESCWEFSSQFNFNETGRYAVSSSGKIYVYDGDNYIPAN